LQRSKCVLKLFPCYKGSFAISFHVGSDGTFAVGGLAILLNVCTLLALSKKTDFFYLGSISTPSQSFVCVKKTASNIIKGSLLVEWFVLTNFLHHIYIGSITHIQYQGTCLGSLLLGQ
jgi:hypothetical protein